MDMTVVDISEVEGIVAGDTATMIGSDGQARITLDEVAELAGTISYEILTGLTSRLPRIWAEADDYYLETDESPRNSV
jgi:alanine racemase